MVLEQTLDQHGILTITLNRPDKLNALNDDVLMELHSIFMEARTSESIKAIIITGAGKAFCAGADISRLAECHAETGYQFAVDGQRVFNELANMGKPSLAVVNGVALGGGCELAIAATMRIASTQARFGQPEVKLGVIPGYGGTQRLARLVGKGRALDLCLTGRFIDAQTALQWGLVSEVVDSEHVLMRGQAILQGMLKLAPIALKSVIEVIEHGYDLSLQDALHLEAMHFAKTCASADKHEGVDAFLNKREPVFKGI